MGATRTCASTQATDQGHGGLTGAGLLTATPGCPCGHTRTGRWGSVVHVGRCQERVRVRVRTGRLIPENEQSKLDIKEVRIMNALPRVLPYSPLSAVPHAAVHYGPDGAVRLRTKALPQCVCTCQRKASRSRPFPPIRTARRRVSTSTVREYLELRAGRAVPCAHDHCGRGRVRARRQGGGRSADAPDRASARRRRRRLGELPSAERTPPRRGFPPLSFGVCES